MEEFQGYTIEALAPGFWAIDDEKGDSMYLIEGSERALLIDTCMMDGDIMPMLKKLTDKPLYLALTHAHIDHMYHADAFEQIYVHPLDSDFRHGAIGLSLICGAKMFKVKRKNYNSVHKILIRENSVIDLGGVKLRVIHAPGHTPGSVLFVDDVHQAVICGDAVGSGSGAWLWLPGCLKISDYKRALEHVIRRLKPYADYQFLGGHRQQGGSGNEQAVDENQPGSGKETDSYPLDLQVFEDTRALCEKMLDGEIKPKASVGAGLFKLYYYTFGHGALVERRGKIK